MLGERLPRRELPVAFLANSGSNPFIVHNYRFSGIGTTRHGSCNLLALAGSLSFSGAGSFAGKSLPFPISTVALASDVFLGKESSLRLTTQDGEEK